MLPFHNPTKVQIPDHVVFYDFKDIRYEVGITICYPHGCGGNFLARAIGNDGTTDLTENNEYNYDGIWLGLDHLPLDMFGTQEALTKHLDSLYNIAKNRGISGSLPMVARTHGPPFLTHAIHGFSTREALFIEINDDDRWFPLCLSMIKNHVNSQWESQPHMIELVLNHCIDAGLRDKLMIAEYHAMVSVIQPHTDAAAMPWNNTLLSWDYLIYCKQKNKNYSIETLGIFLKEWLFNPSAYARYKSDYYTKTRDALRSHAETHTIVSYKKLFMELQSPEHGHCSSVNRDLLRNYSLKNISQVRDIVGLLPDPESSQCLHQLDAWERSVLDA